MPNFNITIGAPSATRLSNVSASKYNVAPRTNEFKCTVNGVEQPAWTTEGRGSHYLYFKQDDTLYYVKVTGPGELTAARQSLIVTTDAYEEVMAKIDPKPAKRRGRAKASA
ncbi:hypothetical protein QTH97_02345 [Variovorax sp. J22R24]|uniref:hypothetical protein n=1 Tax=Variovorax gracilis TaxID=3053502 RepID=UPI002577A90E|nr:hypothetical protein [Variovorax sp. J22R24]MDM0103757.1 hypothetical protein [Variovorax sp. J22R24]